MKNEMEKCSFWAERTGKRMRLLLPAIVAAVMVVGCSSMMMAASDAGSIIQDVLSTIKDVLVDTYGGMLMIVTVLAVVICGWNLIVKMFSKNQRSIEEANQWIKRVCIAWLIFMLLSVIVGFGIGVIGTAGANTATPWA